MCISVERAMVVCNLNLIKFGVELKMLRRYRVEKVIAIILIILVVVNWHHLFYFDLNTFDRNLNQINEVETKEKNLRIKWNNLTSTDFILNEKEGIYDEFEKRNEKRNLPESEDDGLEEVLWVCYPSEKHNYHYFLDHIWIWIDSSIYCFVPFCVMSFCSIVTYAELKRTSGRLLKTSTRTNNKFVQNRIKRNKRIFYLLTSTNLVFIVCTLPYCVLSFKSNDESTFSHLKQTLLIIHIISYSNNSFNFIFYGLFSKQYRDIIIKLFRFCHIFSLINPNDDFTASNKFRT
jgi:hypothetical protein